MAQKTVTISTDLVLAKNSDLLIAPGLLKPNQPYYLLDKTSNTFSGVYILDKYHNYEELKLLQQQQRIYVPLIEFNNNINIRLQQQDFKAKALKPRI